MASTFFEKLSIHKDDEVISNSNYRHMIGYLHSLSHITRTDIATAFEIPSKFYNKPTKSIIKCALRVFGCLRKTRTYGLQYNLDSTVSEILTRC